MDIRQNGLRIAEIPEGKRTLVICIEAMQWALAQKDRDIAIAVLDFFPKDLLLASFVGSNIRAFSPDYDGRRD
jgi:hypothetical protein